MPALGDCGAQNQPSCQLDPSPWDCEEAESSTSVFQSIDFEVLFVTSTQPLCEPNSAWIDWFELFALLGADSGLVGL